MKRYLLAVLVTLACLTAIADAQFAITGTVYYGGYESVGGVKLELHSSQPGTPLLDTVISDYDGTYRFENVPEGEYGLWVYGPDDDNADLVTWNVTVVDADVTQDVAVFKALQRRSPYNHGVVATPNPRLTWAPQNDAEYYIVTLYHHEGQNFNQIAQSGLLYTAEWTISDALTPGESYGWTLEAYNWMEEAVGISEGMSDFTVEATESLETLLTQARGLMADRSLSGWRAADALLETGVATYGTENPELVFLHTLTRSMMLLIRDDGGDWDSFFELLGQFDIFILGDLLDELEPDFTLNEFGYYSKPGDAPTRDDIRNKLDTNTIPKLADILNELGAIESQSNFQMYLYPGETGLYRDVDVDYSDVIILRAALKALKARLETRWAYDTYLTEAEEDAIAQKIDAGVFDINDDLLSPHPYFMTLLPTPGHEDEDGLVRLQQAKQNSLDAIADYFIAVDAIRAETDDQTDDLFYIKETNSHGVDVMDARLTTLQQSLLDSQPGTYPWETTRTYFLMDGDEQEYNLTLTFDFNEADGDAGSFIVPSAVLELTDWRVKDLERCGDELYIDLEPNEPYVGGAAFLLCLLDGDSIINATFDYWGDYNGVISGLSGDLTNTNILTKRFDPTPLFAGEVEPRDMLPDYGPNNRPLPDTMGAGLDYDPTLGDIFPDMTQDDWNEMFDLQPAGEFDFPVVTSGAITADGSLDDWASWEIAPVFIDRTGDADFDPRYQADGIDIHELYIAQDIMTDTVFGAVTSAPIEFLPIAGGADTDYAIIFEYNNGYEPVIIRINMPFDTATGSADIWGNGSLVGTGTAIRSGNVVEFAITPDIPRTPHGGRMLAVHSHYIINGNSYAADENDTGLQYTSSNAISLMRTISGTVTYADYPNAPIIVQAFNDLDDPDGSVLASTMTDGSGSYTLEGIGLGWDGYVRAWAYWHGDTSMYAINGSRVRADYQYVNVASGSLTGINFELGRTITVGEEGDYAFIQDAIDAAQDGDRVFIYEGVYSGYSSSRNIDLNFMGKAITVEGENAPNGVVIDCYYEGNHRGFTFNHGEGPASILRGVTIINGWAPDYATDPEFGPWWGQIGGAIVCDETSPTITNCIFEMCDADYAGALACVNEAAPLIRDCIFQECSASQGGAAACLGNSDVTFENVQFQANAANIDYEIGSGGAVYGEGGSCDFINCLFAGNDCAEYGSAIYSYDQTTNLINCTITDNSAYYAGAVYSDMSWMSLTNCIVWDNISEMSPANPIAGDVDSVTYTCIDDGNPGDGNVPFGGVNNGNIDTNPEFVEYGYWGLYGWVPGDYHLQSGSHCIDSGNDDAVANVATDLDGSPRIQGSHVDMGAYEGAAGPLPDIVAEYIDITDEDADNVYYSFGLANAGGEITSNFYVTFYASEDEYFDPQYDHYLEMTTIGAPVPEGWWLNFDDWTLDRYYLRLPDGVYHLIVVADCDAPPMFYPVVAESDETNNWAVSPQTFTVHGEEFHLSITTQGEGEVSASPPSDPYGYYPVNTEVELTPQSASGWHFAYWWIDNEITMDNVPLYVIMDMDHEVSAVFEPDEVPQYTLNVSVASGSGSIRLTPSGGIYEQGSQVLVRALPESGWRFDHWTGDLIEASNPVLVTMDEDITAAAVFERITTPDIVYYDLTTAVTAGQGIIIPAGGTYQENTTVTLKAVAASGWRVLNWSGANSDPATGQTSVQVTMNANRHVTVAFEKVYTLTTSVIGDLGTISPDGGTYSEGTVVTLTVTPPANYCVKGWLGADNVPAGGELTNTVTMNADKTVRVLCEPLTGSLTAAIIPTLAQLDGAQWRVDGGEWHNSGDAINQLPIGSHTVSFQDVTGWTTPADIAVTISADALTSVQGTYVGVLPQEIETGTLRVWLTSPDGVITPSPQWRLAKVSGWLSGGAILSDIEPGIYEVEFSEVTGWTTPASAPVQIDPGQTTTYSAVYQKIIVNPLPQTGTLIVTSAATDQARWRLADQSWQSTGVTLGDMNPGVYTLQFSSLDDNWLAPGSQTVIIYPGQTTTVSPAFTPVKNAIFVDPDGSNTGNGESGAPYGTIQWAIDRATSGETIVVQPGTYTGPGNVDLDFRGKAITLRSAEGADTCIIDGNGSESHPHRGFWFHSKETADSIVDGFTITCGWATVGGGIFCDGADPTIRNCVIKSNTSLYSGAGLRCNNA
ncbi:MAG: hypothetical protein JW709_03370, partial [Sedimentisphaerales bacterium]|nr:hypothetical protein [Sedimentisphaerales bacterium]